MIVFDTETTGFARNSAVPLDDQPEIIEIALVSLTDDTLEINGRFSSFIKPRRLPLPPRITEITSITNEMLANAPSFAKVLPQIRDFLLGESIIIAHNLPFDMKMLTFEISRLEMLTKFPWPYKQLCTVEETMDIRGKRMKLTDLYEHATGAPLMQTHRAMDDVMALVEVVRWMRTQQRI